MPAISARLGPTSGTTTVPVHNNGLEMLREYRARLERELAEVDREIEQLAG